MSWVACPRQTPPHGPLRGACATTYASVAGWERACADDVPGFRRQSVRSAQPAARPIRPPAGDDRRERTVRIKLPVTSSARVFTEGASMVEETTYKESCHGGKVSL